MWRLKPIFTKTYTTTCKTNLIHKQFLNICTTCSFLANKKHIQEQEDTVILDAIHEQKAETHQLAKQTTKKLSARTPLVKNFFVGVVDKEMLAFPEVIPRESAKRLQNELLAAKEYFVNNTAEETQKDKDSVNNGLLKNLQKLQIYGVNVPKEYHGRGWEFSSSLMLSEIECEMFDVALGLLPHRCIIDVLLDLGTDIQKSQYLPKLAHGSMIACEAVYELNPPKSHGTLFSTHATYDTVTCMWSLNGTKSLVLLPPSHNKSVKQLYAVLAETRVPSPRYQNVPTSAVFLVDSSTPGVTANKPYSTLGCKTIHMQEVNFDNVKLDGNSILGLEHEGNRVGSLLLKSSRLRHANIALAATKKIFKELTEYCIHEKQYGVLLKDLDSIKFHLAKANAAIYSLESMIYLTAGILDEFHNPDVALEVAICKYYGLKELMNVVLSTMHLIGTKLLLDQNAERHFRDLLQFYGHGEPMDDLKLFIGGLGLQHAGTMIAADIRKQRNPLFNAGHMLAKFMDKSTIETPITKMSLKDNLHPSLEPASMCLEHSIARLGMCVDILLTEHGANILEYHNDIYRLTDMVATIYCMFASAARASRSYCIGLQYADDEITTASLICYNGRNKVKSLAMEIWEGRYANNDDNLRNLANRIANRKGAFFEHPLAYNF